MFLSFNRPHCQMCIRIYIFHLKKTNKTRRQKAKETKKEKRISVENLTGYDHIVCEFALCTCVCFFISLIVGRKSDKRNAY